MTDITIGIIGTIISVVLVMGGVPIGVSLILVSFVGIFAMVGERAAFGIMSATVYDFIAKWTLTSIPMFLLMGFVCYHAGLTRGLFNLCRIVLARLPGGLAITAVVGSTGFAAVTGSSIACSAAMARIAVPEMLRIGYHPGLATGSVAAAGTIGALIPPSILFILYGTFTSTPISLLFLGGLACGLITSISYILLIIIRVKLNPALAPRVVEDVRKGARRQALRECWPTLALIFIVFGGLFSGLFTATEAGAIGALAAFAVAAANRSLNFKVAWVSVQETTYTTASIFVIATGVNLFTRFLSLSDVVSVLSEYVMSFGAEPWVIAVAISILYLLLGTILEPLGCMLLTLPILLPIMEASGASMIWYGVIAVKLLETGMISPPVGMNVFVVKNVVGDSVSTSAIFRGIWWFMIVDVVVVGLIIAFPEIVTYLPDTFG